MPTLIQLILATMVVGVTGLRVPEDTRAGMADGLIARGPGAEVASETATMAGVRGGLEGYVGWGYLSRAAIPGLLTGLGPLLSPDPDFHPGAVGRRAAARPGQPADRLSAHVWDLLAASDLGLRQTGNGGLDDLAGCVSQLIRLQGAAPAGSGCVSSTGRTLSGIRALVNLALEQYVGIFSTKTVEEILDLVDARLSGLVPPQHELSRIIHDAFLSVGASLTGNGLTAIEKCEDCIARQLAGEDEGPAGSCVVRPGGPLGPASAAIAGVLEQMAGVLPASVLEQVAGVVRFHLAYPPLAGRFVAETAGSVHALGARLGPGSVSAFEQLEAALVPVLVGLASLPVVV